jgi:ubiquinone/menaquinone biosynthesis C-methylase UbiE
MTRRGHRNGTWRGWRGERAKRRAELAYWAERRALEGELQCGHYEYLFTTVFDLTSADYLGKRVLDVGCGPRGSLEWATMASARIGVDPLADQYRHLRSGTHAMTYVTAGAENLPFDSASFDVVASMNSLDHVRDVDTALDELTRVCVSDGVLLLVVEVNHPPTGTEPHTISWDVLDSLQPAFRPEIVRRFAKSDATIYGSVLAGAPYPRSGHGQPPGILCSRLRRC